MYYFEATFPFGNISRIGVNAVVDNDYWSQRFINAPSLKPEESNSSEWSQITICHKINDELGETITHFYDKLPDKIYGAGCLSNELGEKVIIFSSLHPYIINWGDSIDHNYDLDIAWRYKPSNE